MRLNKCFCLLIIMICTITCIAGCDSSDDKADDEIKEVITLSVPEGATRLSINIADVYRDSKAIVTIISDDGVYESCNNLNMIFKERELKCTVAGAISNIEPHKADWNELLKDETIDLVSHSFNHIRMEEDSEIANDEKSLLHEIVEADKWYENWLGYEHITYVCPENQMCTAGYKILDENDFWAVRRGHRGYNSLSPEEGTESGQWSNLMVQGICDEGVSTETRNGWIDSAVADGKWLIEMWHNVMPADDGRYQTILISDAEKHLDYLRKKAKEGDVWVATYTEAVKYLREKQNVNIEAFIEDDELHIMAELTDERMSYSTFNHPLTIFVSPPEKISIEDSECVITTDKGIMLDIAPGEHVVLTIKEEDR